MDRRPGPCRRPHAEHFDAKVCRDGAAIQPRRQGNQHGQALSQGVPWMQAIAAKNLPPSLTRTSLISKGKRYSSDQSLELILGTIPCPFGMVRRLKTLPEALRSRNGAPSPPEIW